MLVLLAAVFVVSLLLTAFGGGKSQAPVAFRSLSASAVRPPTQTRPFPEILAVRGPVRLQMPISQNVVTAIGYHQADDGALTLAPDGRKKNEGLFARVIHSVFGGTSTGPTWYQLGGGATSALDIGAPVGASVFAPVDGTVVAITPYLVGGKAHGSRIDIQPANSPSVVVSLTQLSADPSLTVGATIVGGATRIGTVADLAQVEKQALSRYTNDAGNHVTVELHPASSLALS
ncbi:MAG TPA: hypothetical protein VHD91_00335 [Gaiellaceae bacterium]|nr:hypothetical protein [Gaiellaceae bacterium]